MGFIQAASRCLTPTSTKLKGFCCSCGPSPRNNRSAHAAGGAGSARLLLPSFEAMWFNGKGTAWMCTPWCKPGVSSGCVCSPLRVQRPCRARGKGQKGPSGSSSSVVVVVFQCPLVPKHRGFLEGLSPERC